MAMTFDHDHYAKIDYDKKVARIEALEAENKRLAAIEKHWEKRLRECYTPMEAEVKRLREALEAALEQLEDSYCCRDDQHLDEAVRKVKAALEPNKGDRK